MVVLEVMATPVDPQDKRFNSDADDRDEGDDDDRSMLIFIFFFVGSFPPS